MQTPKNKSTDTLERFAVRATYWIGSTSSILVHTAFFIVSFVLFFFGVSMNTILLVVTTLVSLEAIYLSIFIQMSMNKQARRLREVARDIDEIQEDIDEIQEDVEEIQEEDEKDELAAATNNDTMLSRIEGTLEKLITEVTELKKQHVKEKTIIKKKKRIRKVKALLSELEDAKTPLS
jgi:low affinity Fe/Cu permease